MEFSKFKIEPGMLFYIKNLTGRLVLTNHLSKDELEKYKNYEVKKVITDPNGVVRVTLEERAESMVPNYHFKIGTIKGRHPLPVDRYIFNEDIKDVTDVMSIEAEAVKNTYLLFEKVPWLPMGDDDRQRRELKVDLYITGLTVVTIACINALKEEGADVTIYHYNAADNTYFPQSAW